MCETDVPPRNSVSGAHDHAALENAGRQAANSVWKYCHASPCTIDWYDGEHLDAVVWEVVLQFQ